MRYSRSKLNSPKLTYAYSLSNMVFEHRFSTISQVLRSARILHLSDEVCFEEKWPPYSNVEM